MYRFEEAGAKFRELREKSGMSQNKLSAKLGYKNGQFVSNVERGKCLYPLKRLNQLCTLLKIEKVDMMYIYMDSRRSQLLEVL